MAALRFHDLTTQQSSDVWLAIPHKAHAPRFDYPPLRVVCMSGPAMTEGIETVDVAGTQAIRQNLVPFGMTSRYMPSPFLRV